jgi:hypothetical protein
VLRNRTHTHRGMVSPAFVALSPKSLLVFSGTASNASTVQQVDLSRAWITLHVGHTGALWLLLACMKLCSQKAYHHDARTETQTLRYGCTVCARDLKT